MCLLHNVIKLVIWGNTVRPSKNVYCKLMLGAGNLHWGLVSPLPGPVCGLSSSFFGVPLLVAGVFCLGFSSSSSDRRPANGSSSKSSVGQKYHKWSTEMVL